MNIKNKNGFSLVEILIFCFISVILMTLIIGTVSNSRAFSRTMGCINNMKNITQAIEQYQADWNEAPIYLDTLTPQYVLNNETFRCPADKEEGNSYQDYYISRDIGEKDANKMLLACPRHQKHSKTVAAYLSYAVNIGKSQDVMWSGTKAEYGQDYSDGTLSFADGTQVEIQSGKAVLLSSFISNNENVYSVIYVPEEEDTTLDITHQGNSIFEVITPSVIAGVEGTKFVVNTTWDFTDPPVSSTTVTVTEGIVNVQERAFGKNMDIDSTLRNNIKVKSRGWEDLPPGLEKKDSSRIKNFVPRRPPKLPPHVSFF